MLNKEIAMLKRGTKLNQFIGMPETTMFDMDGYTGTLFVIVDDDQVENWNLNGRYEYWVSAFNETLFFAFKLNDHEWRSCPYTPYLSQYYDPYIFAPGHGMPLTIVLVDNKDGVIKDIHVQSLSNEMSNGIIQISEYILSKPFDHQRHIETRDGVYYQFQTDEELVEQPGLRCSVG